MAVSLPSLLVLVALTTPCRGRLERGPVGDAAAARQRPHCGVADSERALRHERRARRSGVVPGAATTLAVFAPGARPQRRRPRRHAPEPGAAVCERDGARGRGRPARLAADPRLALGQTAPRRGNSWRRAGACAPASVGSEGRLSSHVGDRRRVRLEPRGRRRLLLRVDETPPRAQRCHAEICSPCVSVRHPAGRAHRARRRARNMCFGAGGGGTCRRGRGR